MYYLCSENKGADQLRGYRESDLRLCFRICKKPVYSRRGSICVYHRSSMFFLFVSDLLDAAFKTFSVPEIAPVAKLKEGLRVLELFHGKTWAFKDLALSCVGQLYNYFCSKKKKHYTIVVGMNYFLILKRIKSSVLE